MNKKVLHIGFLAIVLLLCVTLSVGMLFTGPSQAGANENLSDFPQLKTKEGEINSNFLSQLSAWMGDRFCLRQELISADHWINSNLFGSSGDPSVVLGSEGWLYYSDTVADYTGIEPMSERELFAASRNLSLMAQYCRENEREFVFVIAPNKNSLYNENMPCLGYQAEESDASRLIKRLNTLNVKTVDMFEKFRQEEQTLYFAHDSHWNTKGAALGADLINTAFGLESTYYQGGFSQTIPHTGDLFQMLYPAFTDPEQDYVYGGQLEYSFSTSATRPDAIVLNTNSAGQGTLLAYRDSFGNLLFPFLADTFASARFSRSSVYDLTHESEYVLIELVERNLGYLTQNLPVMPAPVAQIDLPNETAGTINITTSTRSKLLQVNGEFPAVDDDSVIYVVCDGIAYEAFCLDHSGFGLYLEDGYTPEYVVCKQGGALTIYKVNIQK